jgi:hypothetical protein
MEACCLLGDCSWCSNFTLAFFPSKLVQTEEKHRRLGFVAQKYSLSTTEAAGEKKLQGMAPEEDHD